MKKNLFLFLLFAIVAVSCQKDITPVSTDASGKTNEATPNDVKITSLYDKNKPIDNTEVFKKIDAFKRKLMQIEQGTLPESANGMAVADVVWNIEALVNSDYGMADKPFVNQTVDSGIVRIPLTATGEIDNNALLTAVQQTRQRIREQFYAVSNPNKHVVVIDIALKSIQADNGGYATFGVESFIGTDTPPIFIPSESPFGTADNWFYGEGQGRCDGTRKPKDAGIRIAEEINLRTPNPLLYNLFVTDVESVFATGNVPLFRTPYDDLDNNRDYLIYYVSQNRPNYPAVKCINFTDMNWYYQKMYSVISTMTPLAGKGFVSINIFGEPNFELNPNMDPPFFQVNAHLVQIKYGWNFQNIKQSFNP